MSDEPAPIRHFTDREVSVILRTAVELQDQSSDPTDPARGMSLVELENVAREAGIATDHIRRAVAELDAHREGQGTHSFIGAPTRVTIERQLEGEVSPDDFDALVDAIRQRTGDFGVESTVGRSLSWKVRRGSSFLSVTVVARDGKTTIRVVHRLGEHALGVFAGLLTGGAILAAALPTVTMSTFGNVPLAIAVGVAAVVGSYLSARKLFMDKAATSAREAQELMSALQECAQQHILSSNDH